MRIVSAVVAALFWLVVSCSRSGFEPSTLSLEVDGAVVTSYDFGSVPGGNTATVVITARATGKQAITLGGIDDAGLGLVAPYTKTGGSCVSNADVPAGNACTLEVTFTPVTPGVVQDRLSVTYDDGNARNTAILDLQGTGGAAVECGALGGATSYAALGAGTVANPYLLCTAAQLADLSLEPSAWNSAFALGADIDMGGFGTLEYVPLGTEVTPFSGVFDGGGHTVRGFSWHDGGRSDVGLFGTVRGSSAEVRRVHLVDADVAGLHDVGALVGRLDYGAVYDCSATGSVDGQSNVGGLVGITGGGRIAASWASVAVTVTANASSQGGLIGRLGESQMGGFVWDSYATGNVEGFSEVGGLVGSLGGPGIIMRSYATGNVTAQVNVGGLVGMVNDGSISGSFATGSVTGDVAGERTGRLVGCPNLYDCSTMGYTRISGSFSTAEASCTSTGACHDALTGETVVASTSSFYVGAPVSSWDQTLTWVTSAAAFPTLAPQAFDWQAWGTCAEHTSDTPFAGGRGTLDAPFLICTAQQLRAVGNRVANVGRAYRLMADIDLAGEDLTGLPIGGSGVAFQGVFDGGGHVVRNLTIDDVNADRQGLFGVAAGALMRLGVENVVMEVRERSGPLAGMVNGVVADCYGTGSVSGTAYIGGLVGEITNGSLVATSYADTQVSGNGQIGGLIGAGHRWLEACFVAGSVVGSGSFVGPVTAEDCTADASCFDVYYDGTAGLCTGCNNDAGESVTRAYFEDTSHAPFIAWDFSRTWQTAPGGLPKLRPVTP